MKHRDLQDLLDAIAQVYTITKTEYFLGIRETEVFDTTDPRYASIVVIIGLKK
jgi:hypothetical protein